MKETVFVSFVIALSVMLTSGCTVFPNPEPPRVMEITVSKPAHQADQRTAEALRVDTPFASAPFNSSRILAKPNQWEFRAYENVRWRDTAPVVVRDAMVEALRDSAAFASVITDSSAAPADLTLISELSAFHTENTGNGPRAIIELHAQLIRNRSRASLCNHSFRIVVPASGAAIEPVVEAFGAAGNRLSDQLIAWITACDLSSPPEKDPPTQP